MNKGYKLINFCEFDKYATQSYCAIHNVDESLNLGDITKVDETKLSEFNMIVGGSPCQDFSVAGKQEGSVWKCKDCGEEYNPLQNHWSKRDKCPKCESKNLDKSRSSLLVEWLRVIRANKPNFGIYENVKNIVGKQFKDTTFKIFEDELNEYGYNTYWKVLNAKNYGVPQNRERVYLILIKKELDNGKFKFPQEFDSGVRLKDILEDEVDEKYYLSEEVQSRFKFSDKQNDNIIGSTKPEFRTIGQRDLVFNTDGIIGCLVATDYKQPKQILEENKLKKVGRVGNSDSQGNRVYDPNNISSTLVGNGGGLGGKTGLYIDEDYKLLVKNATKQGYAVAELGDSINTQFPDSKTRRGRVQKGVAGTLETACNQATLTRDFKIRKLTPKECFRLMGFSDEDFQKCSNIKISDTQLYKQAGNSIVVDVLYHILIELYIAMPFLFDDLKLSSFFSGIGAFEKALDRLSIDLNNNINFTQPQGN